MFSDLTWKNFFLLQEMVGGEGGGAGARGKPEDPHKHLKRRADRF